MGPSGPTNRSVKLYTDGACIGNPGPGGWAFILKHPASGRSKEGSGGEHASTNNRMEITAVIRGLEALKQPCQVELFSDSEYVVNAVTYGMTIWKLFGWKRSAKTTKVLKNRDLWIRLDEVRQPHQLTARWIRGHSGHPENERCDELAMAAAALVAATPAPQRPAASDVKDAKPYTGPLFEDADETE